MPRTTTASRTLRRLVLLAVLAGGIGWLVNSKRSSRAAANDDEPVWPPFRSGPTGPAWVSPDDQGACPLDHPVKANDNSGIYHMPGGRFYDRTKAERCYVRAADAEADGYRAAKA